MFTRWGVSCWAQVPTAIMQLKAAAIQILMLILISDPQNTPTGTND